MRLEADKLKIETFMAALGSQVRGRGKIYLTVRACSRSSWLAQHDH